MQKPINRAAALLCQRTQAQKTPQTDFSCMQLFPPTPNNTNAEMPCRWTPENKHLLPIKQQASSHQLPSYWFPHARQHHTRRPQPSLHAAARARGCACCVHAAYAEAHKLLDVLLQLAALNGLEGAASSALAERAHLFLIHLSPQLPAAATTTAANM
jgi:hypothetical protein